MKITTTDKLPKRQIYLCIFFALVAIGFAIAAHYYKSRLNESETKAVQSEIKTEINDSKASNQISVEQSASDVKKAVKWKEKGNDVRPVDKEVDSVIVKWWKFEYYGSK